MGELLYLYAVVPAEHPLARSSLNGIGGGAVRAVVEGAIAGAVGAVPAAEFDEEPLNVRLRDRAVRPRPEPGASVSPGSRAS